MRNDILLAGILECQGITCKELNNNIGLMDYCHMLLANQDACMNKTIPKPLSPFLTFNCPRPQSMRTYTNKFFTSTQYHLKEALISKVSTIFMKDLYLVPDGAITFNRASEKGINATV